MWGEGQWGGNGVRGKGWQWGGLVKGCAVLEVLGELVQLGDAAAAAAVGVTGPCAREVAGCSEASWQPWGGTSTHAGCMAGPHCQHAAAPVLPRCKHVAAHTLQHALARRCCVAEPLGKRAPRVLCTLTSTVTGMRPPTHQHAVHTHQHGHRHAAAHTPPSTRQASAGSPYASSALLRQPAHTHTHTHAQTQPHTHIHTYTHILTHTHTHAHSTTSWCNCCQCRLVQGFDFL